MTKDPLPILKFLAENELCDIVWWRCDGEYSPITFFVGLNDVFAWGCADAEELNDDNLPILKQAVADCEAVDAVCGSVNACELFASRVRQTRPQGAAYPQNRELWPLFDAAGPERETGIGNPYRPGEYKPR